MGQSMRAETQSMCAETHTSQGGQSMHTALQRSAGRLPSVIDPGVVCVHRVHQFVHACQRRPCLDVDNLDCSEPARPLTLGSIHTLTPATHWAGSCHSQLLKTTCIAVVFLALTSGHWKLHISLR